MLRQNKAPARRKQGARHVLPHERAMHFMAGVMQERARGRGRVVWVTEAVLLAAVT